MCVCVEGGLCTVSMSLCVGGGGCVQYISYELVCVGGRLCTVYYISPSCIRENDFSAKQGFTVQSAWTKRFVPCTIEWHVNTLFCHNKYT